MGILQVFAPLARLLGLYSIKEELEALSFKHSQPEAHQVTHGAAAILQVFKWNTRVELAYSPCSQDLPGCTSSRCCENVKMWAEDCTSAGEIRPRCPPNDIH